MRVGVPREIKPDEYRVGLTPTAVREYVTRGHEVLVEKGAGAGAGYADSAYTRAGAKILGVSPDPVKSHAKFAGKHELPFTLLADVDKEVSQAYGVWKEKSMYGRKYMGIERTTFVIDPEGIVRKVFPKVKVTGHSDAVLEAVKALRS